MSQFCPFESNLECTQINQVEELCRQMEVSLAAGKEKFFLFGDRCTCSELKCARLLAYREKMQNSR